MPLTTTRDSVDYPNVAAGIYPVKNIDDQIIFGPSIGELFDIQEWLDSPFEIYNTHVVINTNIINRDTFNNIFRWAESVIGVENFVYWYLQAKVYFRTPEQATMFKLKFGEYCK